LAAAPRGQGPTAEQVDGINMPPTKRAARREKSARQPSSIYGPTGELVQIAAGDQDISGTTEVAFLSHAQ